MAGDDESSTSSLTSSWAARVVVAVLGLALVVGIAVAVVRSREDETPASEASPSPSPTASEAPPSDAPPPGEPAATTTDGSTPSGTSDEPAPAPGEVDDRAPVQASFDAPASPRDGVQVRVAQVESVQSQAELPGETSRPALRITVEVTNGTGEDLDIGGALTNLYYGPDRDAATMVQRPGGRPFPATVAAGGTASSVVVYNVPRAQRSQVFLEVSLDATIRRVEFDGDCAGGC